MRRRAGVTYYAYRIAGRRSSEPHKELATLLLRDTHRAGGKVAKSSFMIGLTAAFIGAAGPLAVAIVNSQADLAKTERIQPAQTEMELQKQRSEFQRAVCSSTFALLGDETPNPGLSPQQRQTLNQVLQDGAQRCIATATGSQISAVAAPPRVEGARR